MPAAKKKSANDRLTELEERMAYLEKDLLALSSSLNELLDRCLMLHDQVRILAVRQGEISAVCDQRDETPPPHY